MVTAESVFGRLQALSRAGRPALVSATCADQSGEALVRAAARFGFGVVPSRDGPIAVVAQGPDPEDFSRQTGPFDWHKDGLYRTRLPEFVLLYCQDPGRGDSPTIVGDCERVAAELGEAELDGVDLVYLNHAGLPFPRPIVQPHSRTGRPVVNVAQRAHVAPAAGRIADDTDHADLLPQIRAALYDRIVHEQRWRAGDLLLLDNEQFAHARRALAPDPDRRLIRMWLSCEDSR